MNAKRQKIGTQAMRMTGGFVPMKSILYFATGNGHAKGTIKRPSKEEQADQNARKKDT